MCVEARLKISELIGLLDRNLKSFNEQKIIMSNADYFKRKYIDVDKEKR